jgi:hypothetical protein
VIRSPRAEEQKRPEGDDCPMERKRPGEQSTPRSDLPRSITGAKNRAGGGRSLSARCRGRPRVERQSICNAVHQLNHEPILIARPAHGKDA